MSKYLIRASYTSQGIQGVISEGGTARRAAFDAAAASVGGVVESLYFAFGEDDLYVIVDVPDRANVTALMLVIAAAGAVSCHTTVLLTPEEIDEAAEAAQGAMVDYTPPGS